MLKLAQKSMPFVSLKLFFFTSALVLFSTMNCDQEKPKDKKVIAMESEFFSDSILDEATPGDEFSVKCAGATPEEQKMKRHPQIVRGSLLAPSIHASFGIPFINEANAVAINGETPIPNAKVKIFQKLKNPKMLQETTTDALGRFCLKLPRSLIQKKFDEETYLQADFDTYVLRRLTPFSGIAIISSQSEAIFRIYEEKHEKIRPENRRSKIVNLHTISDTRTDTLGDFSAQSSVEETVKELEKAMRKDQRIKTLFNEK